MLINFSIYLLQLLFWLYEIGITLGKYLILIFKLLKITRIIIFIVAYFAFYHIILYFSLISHLASQIFMLITINFLNLFMETNSIAINFI